MSTHHTQDRSDSQEESNNDGPERTDRREQGPDPLPAIEAERRAAPKCDREAFACQEAAEAISPCYFLRPLIHSPPWTTLLGSAISRSRSKRRTPPYERGRVIGCTVRGQEMVQRGFCTHEGCGCPNCVELSNVRQRAWHLSEGLGLSREEGFRRTCLEATEGTAPTPWTNPT